MNTLQLSKGEQLNKSIHNASLMLSAIKRGNDIRINDDGYSIDVGSGWLACHDPEIAKMIRQLVKDKVSARERKLKKEFKSL